MTNYQRTANWLHACGKGQTVPNLSLQIGCHLEEFSEFLRALSMQSIGDQLVVDQIIGDLDHIGNKLKLGYAVARIPEGLRVAALDALCDTEVTGNGVAYLAAFNKDAADQAVIASNEAKLVDGQPIFLAGGKIGKPEGWTPPDLSRFV